MRFVKTIDKKPDNLVHAEYQGSIGSLSYHQSYFTFRSGEYVVVFDENNPEDIEDIGKIEWLDESESSFTLEDMKAAIKQGRHTYWLYADHYESVNEDNKEWFKQTYNIEL